MKGRSVPPRLVAIDTALALGAALILNSGISALFVGQSADGRNGPIKALARLIPNCGVHVWWPLFLIVSGAASQ